MELYIALVAMFGNERIDAFCENKMYSPKTEAVIELCEPVWENFDQSLFPKY